MDIKRILVPLGGSKYSYNALDYALQMARIFGAHVTGLHVKDSQYAEKLFPNIAGFFELTPDYDWKAKLEEYYQSREDSIKKVFLARCEDSEVDHDFIVQTGLITEAILTSSRDYDLVFMGKKGEHGSWLGRFLGTTCRRTLHFMQRPLAIVDGQESKPIKHMLLAYGGGPYAEKAMEMSALFLKQIQASLTVLTVLKSSKDDPDIQKPVQDFFESRGIQAKYLQVSGKPEEKILEVAKAEDIDFILIGAGKPRGLDFLMESCIADKVLRESTIPLLFVR